MLSLPSESPNVLGGVAEPSVLVVCTSFLLNVRLRPVPGMFKQLTGRAGGTRLKLCLLVCLWILGGARALQTTAWVRSFV